jgi:hypothetical protein
MGKLRSFHGRVGTVEDIFDSQNSLGPVYKVNLDFTRIYVYEKELAIREPRNIKNARKEQMELF